MLMGTRIMGIATGADVDGHRELAGAIYPFFKLAQAAVLAQARQVLAGSAEFNSTSTTDAICSRWPSPAPGWTSGSRSHRCRRYRMRRPAIPRSW